MEDQNASPTPADQQEQEIIEAANKIAGEMWDWLAERDVKTAVGLIAMANMMGQMAASAAGPSGSRGLLNALFKQADLARNARSFRDGLDRAGLSALKPGSGP